jgi:hypothetical protein
MLATPMPVKTPAAARLRQVRLPKPTMNRPMPTTMTAISMLPMVIGTL